jgi:hypothetical protein
MTVQVLNEAAFQASWKTAVSFTGGGFGLPGTLKSMEALHWLLKGAVTTQVWLLPCGMIVILPSAMVTCFSSPSCMSAKTLCHGTPRLSWRTRFKQTTAVRCSVVHWKAVCSQRTQLERALGGIKMIAVVGCRYPGVQRHPGVSDGAAGVSEFTHPGPLQMIIVREAVENVPREQ